MKRHNRLTPALFRFILLLAFLLCGIAMADGGPETITESAHLKPFPPSERTATNTFTLAPLQTGIYNVNIEQQGTSEGGVRYKLKEPLAPPVFNPIYNATNLLWAWKLNDGTPTSRSRQFKVVNTIWQEHTATVAVTCLWERVQIPGNGNGNGNGEGDPMNVITGSAEGIANHLSGWLVPTSDIDVEGAPDYLCINDTIQLTAWLVTNNVFPYNEPWKIPADWEVAPLGENGGDGEFDPDPATNQITVTFTSTVPGRVRVTATEAEYKEHSGYIDFTIVDVNLDGLRVYDPKLETADSANIEYKIEAPADAGFSPRVELTIMDGTNEVACLVRKTEPAPALNVEITKIWDGRWGIKKDGSDSAHIGKFADPKRYYGGVESI